MAGVLDDTEINRVLSITAHPDDVDFGAAGTVARWTEAGIEVIYCVVTDGDAGGSDEDFPRAEMPALRRAEQIAAAKCVGVHDVRFLGYPDGRVEATLGLRRDLARVIRQVRPDRLVCPSPERNYARTGASHPDHRAVGSAALDAVYPDARNPFAFPELLADEHLEPWTAPEVWIPIGPAVNHYVDITATFARKIAALTSHASQISDPAQLADRLHEWGTLTAEAAGLPAGSLAEAFQIIQTGEAGITQTGKAGPAARHGPDCHDRDRSRAESRPVSVTIMASCSGPGRPPMGRAGGAAASGERPPPGGPPQSPPSHQPSPPGQPHALSATAPPDARPEDDVHDRDRYTGKSC